MITDKTAKFTDESTFLLINNIFFYYLLILIKIFTDGLLKIY